MTEADVIEDHPLTCQVPDSLVVLERLCGVPERIGEPFLMLGDPGEAVVDPCLAEVVIDRFEEPERVLQERHSIVKPARSRVPEREAVQGVSLARHVMRAACRC